MVPLTGGRRTAGRRDGGQARDDNTGQDMIATNALDAFTLAENRLRAGAFEEALQYYLRVIRGVPGHFRTRFRVADTLLNLNAARYSFEIYKALAWHAIKAGQPLWGLVAIKMAAAMDKSQLDLVNVVAELYSRNSGRIDRNLARAPQRRLRKTDPIGDIGFLAGQKLVETAAAEAANTEGVEDFPAKLPAIPLFSYLDERAFASVLAGLQLKRFVKDQPVIKEGQPGSSFFILAEGEVAVTREVNGKVLNLARLNDGAVFGEMALIKQAPRTATVTALADCDLLELSRDFLAQQGTSLQSVTRALQEFTHERFLANLAATCAVFKPFPRTVRAEILKKFVDLEVTPGQRLITEGDEGRGLFLILKGQVEVTKHVDGKEKNLAVLKEGDVFGEISLLQTSPTTASCVAMAPTNLLYLERATFNSTIARYPEFKDELSKITAERIRRTKAALNPEEDDFVLIEDDDVLLL
jgi:CRP-like cAMP-binding protein